MIVSPEAVTEDMLAADAPFMQERMAWAEAQEKRVGDGRRLDLTDMPRFGGEWQRSLGMC